MTDSADLPEPSEVSAVVLPGGEIRLRRPLRLEALLDDLVDGPPDPDDKGLYWADLWPSAVALAAAIDDGLVDVSRGCWVELGCGLGLVSLAARRRGADVVATDWVEDALAYTRSSAELNGLELRTVPLDWRNPPLALRPDGVLAADVLYEGRNAPWLIELLGRWAHPGFSVWLSDPGRDPVPPFLEALPNFSVQRFQRTVDAAPRGPNPIDIYRLTASDSSQANR